MKTWDEMTPRERDAAIAERVMGWQRREAFMGTLLLSPAMFQAGHSVGASATWELVGDVYVPIAAMPAEYKKFHLEWVFRRYERDILAHYTTDHNDARLVEDEIDRRGLQDKYVDILLSLKTESDFIQSDHWFLIRATPEQRCHAAWLAVGRGGVDA